jgi:hypothetical protein
MKLSFPPLGGLGFSAFFRKALKKKHPDYPVNPVCKRNKDRIHTFK